MADLSRPMLNKIGEAGWGGGPGSEAWNRVYMIAPVKKFGLVRLSTNMAEKADMEGR